MKINLAGSQLRELKSITYWEAFTGKNKVEDIKVFSNYYNYLTDLSVDIGAQVKISRPMAMRLRDSLEDVIQNRMDDLFWQDSNIWVLRELHFALSMALEDRHWHIHYEALDARDIKLNQTIRIGWMIGKVVFKTAKCVVIVGKWESRS